MSKKILIEQINPTPTMQQQHAQQPKHQPQHPSNPPATNKALLRFQNPIYNVYDQTKYASEKQFMIKKLLKQSKKPKFQLLPKSSLLEQVKSFIPLLKKANDEANKEGMQIDVDLRKEETSEEEEESEESEEEERGKMVVEESSETKITENVHMKEKPEIQLNFLVVQYPQQQQPQQPK